MLLFSPHRALHFVRNYLCRNMWAEFEWENKVAVNTTFTDCNSFLQHIVATTNMQCLTPPTALDGERLPCWCTFSSHAVCARIHCCVAPHRYLWTGQLAFAVGHLFSMSSLT